MQPSAKDVLEQALSLDEADRATVAGALIESLEGPPDPDAETVWAEEILRRVKALETGSIEALPWSEVRERLFRGYE